jgi:hypothetical protein
LAAREIAPVGNTAWQASIWRSCTMTFPPTTLGYRYGRERNLSRPGGPLAAGRTTQGFMYHYALGTGVIGVTAARSFARAGHRISGLQRETRRSDWCSKARSRPRRSRRPQSWPACASCTHWDSICRSAP